MPFVSFLKNLRWINFLFLALTPLISIAGVIFLAVYDGIRLPTVVLGLILAAATGLSITAGYHRLFAHRSYKANGLLKVLFLFFGAASFENSALSWARDHRDHHLFVDTDRDPYSIKKGFWFAHMGWVVLDRSPSTANVADLEADATVRFQHSHYVLIGVLFGFALPMAVASLWQDALGGLLIAGFVRVVLNHHFTFMINSVCHYLGKQPYSDRNSSRDSWIPAIFTYGEGYHNYHHTFPSDYRNGIRAHHWDPTKWLIRFLAWAGQAHGLQRIPNSTILRVRLQMEEARLLRGIPSAVPTKERQFVMSARRQLERAHARFETLKVEYRDMKLKSRAMLDARHTLMIDRVAQVRGDYHRAKAEFRTAWAGWKRLAAQGVYSSAGMGTLQNEL